MAEPILAASTVAWCEERGHPFVTYNPLLDDSWCRCGHRRVAGEQPMDWQAKREYGHNCTCDARGECRCHVGLKVSTKEAA